MFKLVIFLVLIMCANFSWANTSMEGVWRHSAKPAWLLFQFDNKVGKAIVYEHHLNRANQGLIVLKDIVATDKPGSQWSGKMYAADINGFINATLTMPSENKIHVKMTHQGKVEKLIFLKEIKKG